MWMRKKTIVDAEIEGKRVALRSKINKNNHSSYKDKGWCLKIENYV